jgi:hypothetical protein
MRSGFEADKVRQNGGKMVRKSDEIRSLARRFFVEDGMPFREIGRKLKLPHQTIQVWAKEEGWPKPPPREKKPLGILLDKGDPRQAEPRAKKGEPAPQPIPPPNRDEIVGVSDTLKISHLKELSLEARAEVLLNFALVELAARQSSPNLAKVADLSVTILKGIRSTPGPDEALETIAQLRAQVASLQKETRPPEDGHSDGEIPEPSREDAGG